MRSCFLSVSAFFRLSFLAISLSSESFFSLSSVMSNMEACLDIG